ncbi:nitrite transporter [Halopseudomonas pachastrellae]|nr:nitrite transporter [Halopseudomonas pachastrellae]
MWPQIDCYGLVLLVRRDLGLPDWPEWGGVTKKDDGLHNVGTEFVRKLERCEPQPGAVACCYAGGLMIHVAVVVVECDGLQHSLEINARRGTTCLPLRRFERRFVRVEYYR